MTRPTRTVTVGAWNVDNGRGAAIMRGVRALIRGLRVMRGAGKIGRRHRPLVIALSECWGIALRAVKLRTALKHRTFAPRDYARQDAALVVSKRADVSAHGIVWVEAPWVGPSKVHWAGKAIPWVIVDGTLYVAVHNVWDPVHLNQAASDAVLDALVQLVLDHPGLRVVLMGDWNRINLRAFVRRLRGLGVRARLIRGQDVDNAVVIGFDGTAEVGDQFGGDHVSVIYLLDPIGA